MLLRQFLCGDKNHRLGIDPGLLRALQEVPCYRNGVRSFEKLSLSLKPLDPTAAVRRSSLCSPEQLAMFVDFPDSTGSLKTVSTCTGTLTPAEIHRRFVELCRSNEPFQNSEITESLAAAVHGYYQKFVSQPGMTIQEINNRDYFKTLVGMALCAIVRLRSEACRGKRKPVPLLAPLHSILLALNG